MAEGNDVPTAAEKRLSEEVKSHLRLGEALERLARVGEEVAETLNALGMSEEADDLLARSAAYYRRAAEETRQAKHKREQLLELKG